MSSNLENALQSAVQNAAGEAGLHLRSSRQGKGLNGSPTIIFELARPGEGAAGRFSRLEISEGVELTRPELLPALVEHLRGEAKRLLNPKPNAYVTLAGIPVTMDDFLWPFHRSTSGADTYIVHGVVTLADEGNTALHAKVAASMTVTFAEIVPAPEQPYAESFIYNAVRKTLDQGQLELLKSGNRQPVPVTTRYYSRWQNKFIFTDSTPESRKEYLLSKVFWLSGALGGNAPLWIADPRDAQYLNATSADLTAAAAALANEELLAMGEGEDFAAATPTLMARASEFHGRLKAALGFTKPTFNEEMRAGHTNM